MTPVKSSITTDIEAAIVDGVKRLFGKTLKGVEVLEGPWTEQTIRHVLHVAPAVYVAWIGGRRGRIPRTTVSTWALFISAKVLNGKRTDDISAQDIAERLTGWLDGELLAPAAGAFVYTQSANLFSDSSAKNGLAIYGLYFEAPQFMPDKISIEDAAAGIADFETHYQTWVQEDGTPEMAADIHLTTGEHDDE